jgi:hypothetical protein
MAAKEAKCAFAPDVRRFDRHPVRQNRQQRENGAIGEIGLVENAARLAHDVTKLEFDPLKMSIDPRTLPLSNAASNRFPATGQAYVGGDDAL